MAKLTSLRKKKLKEYIEDINKFCPVEAAYLFGSWATGHAHKDSDYDIAVFSKKINYKNRFKYMSEFLGLIFKYKTDFQPVAYNMKEFQDPTNDFINYEIKKKGLLIFENNEFKI